MLEPVLWKSTTGAAHWRRARLRELGKDEAFLEALIAEEPVRLLGLHPLDMPAPLVALRQCAFTAPQGHGLYPDVIVLSASGQVAVVEVKLHDNPELKGRQVIAQVAEYASVLTSCTEAALLEGLASGVKGVKAETWDGLVEALFRQAAATQAPTAALPPGRLLAQRLLENIREGRLHLVVACDEAPEGLRSMVEALARQSAVDFRFHLSEVAVFVPPASKTADELLLLPAVPVTTEVVARTVVRIETPSGGPQPQVAVQVTAADEVASRVEEVRSGRQWSARRTWTEEEFEAELRARVPTAHLPPVLELYSWLRHTAVSFSFGSGTQSGSFNPRLAGFNERSVLSLLTDGRLMFNLEYQTGEPSVEAARDRLLARLTSTVGGTPSLRRNLRYELEEWAPKADAIRSALESAVGDQD